MLDPGIVCRYPAVMSARYPIPQCLPQACPVASSGDGSALGLFHRTELIIRRSRFITTSGHAPSTEAARLFIESVRQTYPDATHNCWAFAAGAPGHTAQAGFSDDGEPHGTAGRPMLTVLLHSGIGEVVSVVTRYFGGVKLGTGGLVRAYQNAVRENLESLPQGQRIVPARAKIVLDYPHVDRLRRLLPHFEACIEQESFSNNATFQIMLPAERMADFIRQVADQSNGNAQVTELNETP